MTVAHVLEATTGVLPLRDYGLFLAEEGRDKSGARRPFAWCVRNLLGAPSRRRLVYLRRLASHHPVVVLVIARHLRPRWWTCRYRTLCHRD